jgi:non-heme chloroperoxidase
MTITMHGFGFAALTSALIAFAQPGSAQTLKYKPISVKTPDGLTISAQEWGNPNGPEILLIHGFGQSHLSWARQTSSDLAREFRIITYDMRGHGYSDKPGDKASYHDNKAWADELKAVIETTGLKRPVVVGWSYASRVVVDYLTAYGADKLAGINLVGGGIKAFAEFAGDNNKNVPGMMSDDLATNIAVTAAFVRGCFEKQPTAEDFELMLGFNMLVPTKVRANLLGRPLDGTEVMSKLKIPVLVTHGDRDGNQKVGTAEYTAKVTPGAKLSVYQGIGHATFYEDAARFNTELAAFVRGANKAN